MAAVLRICVDSNSQLAPRLAERFGIAVVPVTVVVDGQEFREGVDLDADRFYEFWADGHHPVVSTSQPPPGAVEAVYRQLIGEGATEILSIHVAATMSGTVSSARIGAAQVPVPVRVVDSRTASFGIACCAWAAAEAVAAGADIEEAAAIAEHRADRLGAAFVVGVPALTERSGRAEGLGVEAAGAEGIPVLTMSSGQLAVRATVSTPHAAVASIADYALHWTPSMSGGLRVAVGTSDVTSAPLARALTELLEGHGDVADVVQYRIGPSVGAHTGPGTAGLFVF
jgi:fatty acid kinase fatty acid binding subunit